MGVSLDRLSVFQAVVEAGSFAAAARRLHQARAAVSFQVRQLETELGVMLLHRTTRSLSLTSAGERFHARCLRILSEAEEAVSEARSEQTILRGDLRVASTVEYGAAVIAPALSRFGTTHPDLDIYFEGKSASVDLVRDRFDVAIRLGRVEQFSDLSYVGTRLGTYQIRPVAAPEFAAASHGATPATLGTLPHVTNATVEGIVRWTMRDAEGREHSYEVTRPSRFVANSASSVKAMAIAGAGVAFLPDWLVANELGSGRLVDMLPSYRFPELVIYALHVPTRSVPRKIGALIEHLRRSRSSD